MPSEVLILAASLSCAALASLGISLSRKLAASRESNRQLREIFLLGEEAAFIVRASNPGHVVVARMNAATSALLPEMYEGSELPLQSAKSLSGKEDFMRALTAHLCRAVNEAIPTEYETAIRNQADDRAMNCKVHLYPLLECGVVGYVMCAIRMGAPRHQPEKAKSSRGQEFKMLVEQSPDAIARYDRLGHRIYANPAFRRLTGLSAPSIIVDEYCGENYRLKLLETMESGLAEEFECTWQRGTGLMTSLIYLVPEVDAAGNVAGVLSIGRDISVFRETEDKLRESRNLLRELSARRESELQHVRKEVAREMHEDYGQRLSALRMNLAMMNMMFAKSQPELGANLDESIQLLDVTIAHMREIVSVIHPSILNMNLSAALEWLADETLSITGIDFEVRVENGIAPLDEMTVNLLYRLVQSALSNVVRHAHASNVNIILAPHGEWCRLEIRDDGRGFDLDRSRKDSLGMVAMEELANMLHGEIVFLSSPGKGTVIEVCFPPGAFVAQPVPQPV